MIDRQELLSDLQDVLKQLEADLLDRSESDEVPEVGEALRAEFNKAKQAERTAQNYEDWRGDYITQVAAAWVLSCVFVRFLEDNRLVDPPKIAGPRDRLQRARDEHEIYFRKSPTETDREYLRSVFDELATLQGASDVFGEHNPIHEQPRWLSGDAAGELLRFFRRIDADTGDLIHDFTDPEWGTRFLGDLYQDLSEAARKKYALLQTPGFVEEFILDRTVDPALDEFGLEAAPVTDREGKPINAPGFRMIDPACGSGHFLLGSFRRILDTWQRQEPGASVPELVQKALDAIHGVDINPFAIAIARFRLLLAALKASNVSRLVDAPAFHMNLACGDSLYHGVERQQTLGEWTDESHYFATEDTRDLRRILREGSFHCVVANPPYITPKDRAANNAYRRLYSSCHMKYSLAVPFMERIFRLAVRGDDRAGYTGQITANSFMKREFGKKLIEKFFTTIDLTHVIDTSGAFIPGHGTPTVILFGKNRKPIASTVRTAMGKLGEPTTPTDASQGHVWTAILAQLDEAGSESAFVSVADSEREPFLKHPWSLGGGGAYELKAQLDASHADRIDNWQTSIGFASFPGLDDPFVMDRATLARFRCNPMLRHPCIDGEATRDWRFSPNMWAFAPYDETFQLREFCASDPWFQRLSLMRSSLESVLSFGGKTRKECGDPWWGWYRWIPKKYSQRLGVVFANVATHNQFVLSNSGELLTGTVLVIKFRDEVDESKATQILGVANSSVGAFWMKQVFQTKGSSGIGRGVYDEAWEKHYQYDGTKLRQFPLPEELSNTFPKSLHEAGLELERISPLNALRSSRDKNISIRTLLRDAKICNSKTLGEMIRLQEDLDWESYRLYGLIDQDLTYTSESFGIQLGERAFEIVLARKMACGEIQTTWFERHGSTPITELPDQWPDDYKKLVQRRIEAIESNPQIALIEQPVYKRRWNTEPWDSQAEQALRGWLLDRLESYFDFDGRMNEESEPTPRIDISVISVAKLADIAGQDPQVLEVGEVYRDDPAFDVMRLVEELVSAEHVPLLPILRYKPAGLRKRAEWVKTWELQRAEDVIDARTNLPKGDPDHLAADEASDLKRREIGDIPVPPKYKSSDFISTGGARYWHLRGKLDVPKERWVSFPHCQGEDGTLMIAWAGYDHLQLARAISAYYVDIQERLGGRDDPRLQPLLACLIELLPWLKQWHNDVDPEFNVPMGDYFEGFIQDEARQMNKTIDEIKRWQPPQRTARRRRRANT